MNNITIINANLWDLQLNNAFSQHQTLFQIDKTTRLVHVIFLVHVTTTAQACMLKHAKIIHTHKMRK